MYKNLTHIFLLRCVKTDPLKCPTVCDKNASCLNETGLISCKCNSGFTGNGTFCSGKKYFNDCLGITYIYIYIYKYINIYIYIK